MSQNRVQGFQYNVVLPEGSGSITPPDEFQTDFTIDELVVVPVTPMVGTTGFTVTLDPNPSEGDRIVVKDVSASGNCSAANQILIQTVPRSVPQPFPAINQPPLPAPPQASIFSPTFGVAAAIALSSSYQEATLTFSEQANAWLSTL